MRVGKHQELYGKFDIDPAAGIVLEVEAAAAIRMRRAHLLAHRGNFPCECSEFALAHQNFATDTFELASERGVAGTATRARQRLVLPDPRVLRLVFAEC